MTAVRERMIEALTSAPSFYSYGEAGKIADAVSPAVTEEERRTLTRAREERDAAVDEYEEIRDAVIDHLNPPDSDAAEVGILVEAIERAARVLVTITCSCAPTAGPPEWEWEPCDRCAALGRARDVRLDR